MARARKADVAPAALVKRVQQELADGWAAGLTVLTGDDLYHLDAAQRMLLSSLVSAEDSEFALTVFGEQRIDVRHIVAAARSAGMFARRRLVLVRELSALEGDPEPLREFAEAPPTDCYLFVRAPVLDRRRKMHQVLARSGRLLSFVAPTGGPPGRLARDVTELARGKGLHLDRDAATFLAEICGGDFYRVDTELEKIRCHDRGDGGTVGIDVVRDVAAGSGILSGWEVADAVLQRDLGEALGAVRRLVESGEEPLKLLGGLAFRARGMLAAKAAIEDGKRPESAIAAARLWGPSRQRIAAGLGRYELSELLAFPGRILAADVALKSRALPPRAVLESLVQAMVSR